MGAAENVARVEQLLATPPAQWPPEFWHPEIVYRPIQDAPDDHGPMDGEQLAAYFGEWLAMFEDFTIEALSVEAFDDERVLAEFRFSGRMGGSESEVSQTIAIIHRFRDGCAWRSREFATADDARKAAAAGEPTEDLSAPPLGL